MKIEKHFPSKKLKEYKKHFVVSENDVENDYNAFSTPGFFFKSLNKIPIHKNKNSISRFERWNLHFSLPFNRNQAIIFTSKKLLFIKYLCF